MQEEIEERKKMLKGIKKMLKNRRKMKGDDVWKISNKEEEDDKKKNLGIKEDEKDV